MTARALTFRALTATALLALALSACASAPPGRPGDHGPKGRPTGRDEPPGRDGASGNRPQLFISPSGQPFRAPEGAPYPVSLWFDGADTDHDHRLTREEFVADAGRFFAVLDVDHDGVVDGFEVSAYEKSIVPEILLGASFAAPPGGGRGGPLGGGRPGGKPRSPGGGLQGAAPYSLLAEPQPVMGSDADFNRRVTREEALKAARARFALLDRDADGILHPEELPQTPTQGRRRPGEGPNAPHKGRTRP
jgi:hypothetical protein